jgi:hypothetical protein
MTIKSAFIGNFLLSRQWVQFLLKDAVEVRFSALLLGALCYHPFLVHLLRVKMKVTYIFDTLTEVKRPS